MPPPWCRQLRPRDRHGLTEPAHASPLPSYKLAPGSWRASVAGAPLLPFSQMGIIALEVSLMLWGPPAMVSAFIAKRDGPTETPDLGAVMAKYSDGRIFSLACSYVAYKSYWISVSGPSGTATWDRIDANSLRIDAEPTVVRTPYVSKDEQLDELHEFRDCILQHKEPDAGAECIYNLAAYYRAIGESIASGRATPFVAWK